MSTSVALGSVTEQIEAANAGDRAPVVFILCWWSFASPKAPRGGPVTRPVVKVVAFGLASLGLWVAGQHALAIALLVFSVVINGLAQLPVVRRQLGALEPVS